MRNHLQRARECHTQFYGPASVDGQVEDPNFGHIVGAAEPRLVQLVAIQFLVR